MNFIKYIGSKILKTEVTAQKINEKYLLNLTKTES